MRHFLAHITIIFSLTELVHSRTSLVKLKQVLRHKRNDNYTTIQPVDEAIHETIHYMKAVGGINIIAQSGTFEINFPNGKALKVQYQADEKGYVVKKQQYQSSVDLLSSKSLQTKTRPPEDVTLSKLANDFIREPPITSRDLTENSLSTLTPLPSNGTIIFPTPLPDIDNRVPIISNIAIGLSYCDPDIVRNTPANIYEEIMSISSAKDNGLQALTKYCGGVGQTFFEGVPRSDSTRDNE